ncbi:hypothetical protein [Deinococcus puniceus]|uniref:DUF4064 domain-containing protein n=1 Tax=Deinococcus puniceus TaxID=1182568 RepID=A0A172TBH5_9DEIO|nr:hypothetical protein [Deinococcus puniceus]ANE44277.1 hypothetical protein SU48_11445 [Deinococcus puniceus]
MSLPTPPPTAPRPPRLTFVTTPLLIALIYNAISLLTLPFSGDTINETVLQVEKTLGAPMTPMTPELVTTVLWVSFFITSALVLLLYFTRRALLEGRSWGRVSSIVIAVLSLLLFPFGTVLGIFMLIGAFDKDVQAYANK